MKKFKDLTEEEIINEGLRAVPEYMERIRYSGIFKLEDCVAAEVKRIETLYKNSRGFRQYSPLSQKDLQGMDAFTGYFIPFLTDCIKFRRSYGWNSLAGYGICLLSMLALFVVSAFRLFKALSRPALFWVVGIACVFLLAGLLAFRLTIRSKGSDQVEPLMEEKWKAEKRVAPEHNEEVDLYRAAVRSNRTITWLSWHLAGVLLAGLILWLSL